VTLRLQAARNKSAQAMAISLRRVPHNMDQLGPVNTTEQMSMSPPLPSSRKSPCPACCASTRADTITDLRLDNTCQAVSGCHKQKTHRTADQQDIRQPLCFQVCPHKDTPTYSIPLKRQHTQRPRQHTTRAAPSQLTSETVSCTARLSGTADP
jgi:hypothetical protein